MQIAELVGKRCLLKISLRDHWASGNVTEYKVLEVSPSGNWVKLLNMTGDKFWRPVSDIGFVEELRDLKADKPL